MPRREQAHTAVFENRNQNHAGDEAAIGPSLTRGPRLDPIGEAADVRAPSDAALDVAGEVKSDAP